jgi:hypothetical protein
MARSSELRQVLQERFYPFADQQGFVRSKSSHPHFMVFRRQREAVIHVFDVQWDKYHKPRFVINFGAALATSMDAAGTPVPAEHVNPSDCTIVRRLQRQRGGSMGCWFQLRKPWLEVLRSGALSYSPAEAVDQAILAFAEVEAWWATRVEGPHVYIWHRKAECSK